MRQFLIIIFIITSNLTFSQNENNELKFKIDSDTTYFKSPSSSSFILKNDDKFYMFAEQDLHPYTTQEAKFLKIFKSKKIEFETQISDNMNTVYIDFFKKNDSILYKKYLDNDTYYLDKKFSWIKTAYKSDDLIYQDKYFYVTSLNFGEFGQRTWFKDKKTKREYDFDLFVSIINKIKNDYYITKSKNIYLLSNPKTLRKTPQSDYYNNYKNSNKYSNSYKDSNALKILFSTDKKDFYIATSFVFNNRLYHICRESESTYIGEIIDKKITIVQELPKDIIPFSKYFNYRNKIQNNKQIVQFLTKENNLTGIIEINNNKVTLFYFKNQYKNEYLDYANAKIEFEKKVDFLYKNIGKISLKEISNYEKIPVPVTHYMKLQYSEKKNQDFKGPQIYKTIEDNFLELHTLYSYNNQNIIEGITFDWNRNLDYENKTKSVDHDSIKKGENERYNNIKKFLISKFGKPKHESENDDNKKNTWEIEDKIIRLDQGTYYLEMKIFTN